MGESILIEVLKDGEEITTLAGHHFVIRPWDIPTVCTWVPTCRLMIEPVNPGSIFDHKINNIEIGVEVLAKIKE